MTIDQMNWKLIALFAIVGCGAPPGNTRSGSEVRATADEDTEPGTPTADTIGDAGVIEADVPEPAVVTSDSQTVPTEAECSVAVEHSKEYDGLIRKARICKRDVDCRASLGINLCSDCRVMVNQNSRHLRRLRLLEEKYEDDDTCHRYTCTTQYNCGYNPSGECVRGRCQTTTDDRMPECGSPSRFHMPW